MDCVGKSGFGTGGWWLVVGALLEDRYTMIDYNTTTNKTQHGYLFCCTVLV
jgi:hypothetical protein